MRGALWLLAGMLILGLGACGQAPQKPNAMQAKAYELHQRGMQAFQRGEYATAAQFYQQAVQLHAATEEVEGLAVNRLNLAKAQQMQGQIEAAQRTLDELLEDKVLRYAPDHLAAAAVHKAVLFLQQRDAASARAWADKAAAYCADCGWRGVIENVQANAALLQGEADQALYWAERAVASNKRSPVLEQANALRLLAQARMLKREFAAAEPLLQQALAKDKAAGLPEKMRLDLLLLAELMEQQGETEQALQYRERARRIEAALGKRPE